MMPYGLTNIKLQSIFQPMVSTLVLLFEVVVLIFITIRTVPSSSLHFLVDPTVQLILLYPTMVAML